MIVFYLFNDCNSIEKLQILKFDGHARTPLRDIHIDYIFPSFHFQFCRQKRVGMRGKLHAKSSIFVNQMFEVCLSNNERNNLDFSLHKTIFIRISNNYHGRNDKMIRFNKLIKILNFSLRKQCQNV